MTRALQLTDFRAVRHILEPRDFALGGDEEDPPPTDQIRPEIWKGMMNLPDDVAVRISDHNGTQLELLYILWGDWIEAVGDPNDDHDELFGCMIDANDCFQCANFDLLHGFYRSAIANLRTALELVMIGTFGNRCPADPAFQRWKQSDEERFGFSYCRNHLRQAHAGDPIEWLFDKSAFPAITYAELCKFTHARPDSSDFALWRSNGPVYNGDAILRGFKLSLDVYATCYLLVKVGRPAFKLPAKSNVLFRLDWMTHHLEMLDAFQGLYPGSTP